MTPTEQHQEQTENLDAAKLINSKDVDAEDLSTKTKEIKKSDNEPENWDLPKWVKGENGRESMRFMGIFYERGVNNVYYTTTSDLSLEGRLTLKKIEWADSKSFQPIGSFGLYDYSKDANHVYYMSGFLDIKPEIIEWVDLKTFQPIGWQYLKDANHVYYKWPFLYEQPEIIEWADPKTFKVMNNDNYAKDVNHVYNYWRVSDRFESVGEPVGFWSPRSSLAQKKPEK
jgi:hypothetical protein